MTSKTSLQDAGAAARRILGCYPELLASDKRTFTTTLVELLMKYPKPVVEQAVEGIPTTLKFLNLAEVREALDELATEHAEHLQRQLRPIPQPLRIPVFKPPTPGDLANVFVPKDHHRYAGLVNGANAGNERFWKLGKASDGREGIWIAWNVWHGGWSSLLTLSDLPTLEPMPNDQTQTKT